MPNKSVRFYLTIFLLLITGLLNACSGGLYSSEETIAASPGASDLPVSGYPTLTGVDQKVYPVDARFGELYDTLGGQEMLGPAISPVIRDGTRLLQYVENALMVYDETKTLSDRFRLAPLGVDFGIAEKPVPNPQEAGLRYVGGHIVLPEFVAIYDALGGVRFFGKPITEAHYNPVKSRTEQYFENLGVFHLDQDKPGVVRLMAYGAFACDHRCRYQPLSAGIPGRQPWLPEPFQSQANLLGLHFTGRALTSNHLAADKTDEVIFENIVLVSDSAYPNGVKARPIVELLGFLAHPLGQPNQNPLMTFIEVQDGLGYNVPRLFENFLKRHGGIEFSGLPISETFPIRPGAFRQCFENLCMEYDMNAAPAERLYLAPLGARYKVEIFDKAMDFQKSLSVGNIDLSVWEKYRWLPAGKEQEIFVLVNEAGDALKNREPILILSLPSGETQTSFFPPTGSDGQSSLKVPGVQAPNGTLIAYKVCLKGFHGESRCVGENYLIWNSK